MHSKKKIHLDLHLVFALQTLNSSYLNRIPTHTTCSPMTLHPGLMDAPESFVLVQRMLGNFWLCSGPTYKFNGRMSMHGFDRKLIPHFFAM
jgi:hypothetical protein